MNHHKSAQISMKHHKSASIVINQYQSLTNHHKSPQIIQLSSGHCSRDLPPFSRCSMIFSQNSPKCSRSSPDPIPGPPHHGVGRLPPAHHPPVAGRHEPHDPSHWARTPRRSRRRSHGSRRLWRRSSGRKDLEEKGMRQSEKMWLKMWFVKCLWTVCWYKKVGGLMESGCGTKECGDFRGVEGVRKQREHGLTKT